MTREADFSHAVETARQHIPIMQLVRREECWTGFAIVQREDGQYRVYDDDAWDEPGERPMLPWSPPTGEIVAHVDLDGRVV
jgi:hypothetical protein